MKVRNRLFRLLELNPYNNQEKSKLNICAVIQEAKQSPLSTDRLYLFPRCDFGATCKCYPLHQAIRLLGPKATPDIIEVLSSPEAVKGICEGTTALHLAIEYSLSAEIIALLFHKWPEAVYEKSRSGGSTPLHIACRNNYYMSNVINDNNTSSLQIISLLLNYWPEATQQTNVYGSTPLHFACSYKASIEVISLLLQSYPAALQIKDDAGFTPLLLACNGDTSSSYEVIKLLLQSWPNASQEKNYCGLTPLHKLCSNRAPNKIISLLLTHCPGALKEKSTNGCTPLHLACNGNASLNLICTLLEKWPDAARECDNFGKTPLDCSRERKACDKVQKVLDYVSKLCSIGNNAIIDNDDGDEEDDDNDKGINIHSSKKILNFFLKEIEWYGGIILLMDRYPSVVSQHIISMDDDDHDGGNVVDTKLLPYFLSLLGRTCKITTLSQVIGNKQDLY